MKQCGFTKLLARLFGQPWEPSVINCNNQNCIEVFDNPVIHDRPKHVKTHYHYVHDMVQKGAIQLNVSTSMSRLQLFLPSLVFE